MKKIFRNMTTAVLLSAGMTACFNDLDTMPLDDNQLVSEQVYTTADGYTGMLAKCYGSLILTGQKGGDGGDGDLEGANEGYSGYVRLLFYLQEMPTDNFLMPSSSNGLRKCLNLQWDASNAPVATWTYQRLYMTIAYCNEMLRECTDEKIADRGLKAQLAGEVAAYRAEVRFIRAYCYASLCDLFGGVPYIDETTGVKDIPEQMTRQQTFELAESELKAVEPELKAPGQNVYGRVDRVACWFLLSRLYLNAQVYTGTERYTDALTYAKKVINEGGYPLARDYREIFLADNESCSEIIWPLVQDGQCAQSSAGTNFYVKAFVNGPMDELYRTGVGSRGWGNVRAKMTLVDAFDADDVAFNPDDTWGNQKKDKRAQFMTALPNQKKETCDENGNMTSTYTCGYGYIKWRNVTRTGDSAPQGEAYTSIDFPLFRTSEAYLTAAEVILRGASGGSRAEALQYVNGIRERAYMHGAYAKAGVRSDVAGAITDGELTLSFILDERQRELASELVRRTDLVRYGLLCKGRNWDWKDGVFAGRDVDTKYNLFAIPETELTNNPSLKQNEGF